MGMPFTVLLLLPVHSTICVRVVRSVVMDQAENFTTIVIECFEHVMSSSQVLLQEFGPLGLVRSLKGLQFFPGSNRDE